MWSFPATVQDQGLVIDQPSEVPMLIFASRRGQGRGKKAQLELLCLDKETGRSVYRRDSLPDSGVIRAHAEHGAHPSVTIKMSDAEIRLSLVDKPRPPEPPAQHNVETGEKQSGGMWELGRRVSDAIQNALKNPGQDLPRSDAQLENSLPARGGLRVGPRPE